LHSVVPAPEQPGKVSTAACGELIPSASRGNEQGRRIWEPSFVVTLSSSHTHSPHGFPRLILKNFPAVLRKLFKSKALTSHLLFACRLRPVLSYEFTQARLRRRTRLPPPPSSLLVSHFAAWPNSEPILNGHLETCVSGEPNLFCWVHLRSFSKYSSSMLGLSSLNGFQWAFLILWYAPESSQLTDRSVPALRNTTG
jgi:hypothetical protein